MSQRGWLTKEDRRKLGKVWIFHWYKDRAGDGKRVENTAVVGRVYNFPKASSAWAEVERRGLNHNIDGANALTGRITFGELAHSYEQHAVPKLACTTQQTVRHIIDDYLIPRWGKQPALNIRALDIETWLGSLPLANPTKDKLRRTMFRVYFKAQKHGFKEEITLANPDSLNVVAISLWANKADAEVYSTNTYPEVLNALANVIDGTAKIQAFEVVTSTSHNVPVDMLTFL